MPDQPLNIVVLGGSFAGINVAHRFLDNIKPQLSTFEGAPTYRVVLISPSTHLYWNICAPRALVSPTLFRPEDAFLPIEPAFARHSFNDFTFMQGCAIGIETSTKQLTVELIKNVQENRASGGSRTSSSNATTNPTSLVTRDMTYRSNSANRNSKVQNIPYHALIIATGSSSHSPLYSLHGTHEDTLASLKAFHRKLDTAHSVMIVGGGPSGVETAGQLATYYNRTTKWRMFKERQLQSNSATDSGALARAHNVLFRSSGKRREGKETLRSVVSPPLISPRERHLERDKKRDSGISGQSLASSPIVQVAPAAPSTPIAKTITLLSGGRRLLPKLAPAVGKKAERQLKSIGVHVVHNLRELSHTTNADGSTNCILNNDMTITSDVLVSATGVYPNTRFLPQHMLDESGYVTTDPRTLRVQGPVTGARVYALGDCASYSKNYTLDVYDAAPVLMKNLHNDLLAHEYRLQTVTSIPVQNASVTTASGISRSASPIGEDANKAAATVAQMPLPESPKPPQQRTLSPPPKSPYRNSPRQPPSTPVRPNNPRQSLGSSTTNPTSPISSPQTTHPIPKRPLLTSEEARKKLADLEDAHFDQVQSDSQLMPITRFGGVGVIFDWKMPSFGVYLLKGRKYRLGRAKEVVGKGRNPYGVK